MVYFRLVTAALLPVIFAILFYIAEKKTKWNRLPYIVRQIIIGAVFGGIACLATEFGIPTEDVVLNVRNAAPLTAGLLFGGPAGVIAGFIGGIHRYVSVLWGIGKYSQLACTIATVLAGLIGAFCRKVMFDNKKSSWIYGLFVGTTTEVLHMLILFLTKMNDIETAFTVIKKCAVPMIFANGLSVMLAILAVSFIGKEKIRKKKDKKQIAQTFSNALLICVFIAFVVTTVFTFVFQNKLSIENANQLLSLNINDVKADITDASDYNLLKLTHNITDEIYKSGIYNEINVDSSAEERALRRDFLVDLIGKYNVTDINIIDKNGIIILSTYEEFDLFYMGTEEGGQATDFLCLLNGETEYVQDYGPTDFNPEISRKYAGVSLKDGGFVQVGYDAEQFQDSIAEQVFLAANNRHVGKDGLVIICKQDTLDIVSSPNHEAGQHLVYDCKTAINEIAEGNRFSVIGQNGEDMFCMYAKTEGYVIISALPESEALFSRGISVYISVFMQNCVFAALFVLVYFLIKNIVVDNIHKINDSLAKITGGDLSTKVDVRGNEEFASLSDDINTTVSKLKDYIAEAAARIDKELEFAKAIQLSAMPNVFPPYPNRKEFDIHATVDTAKEVGGDFYDFYLLDNDKLGFLIADVSGKGIPAAMFMMTSKTIIKSFAEAGMEVNDIFENTNMKLCEGNEAGMFVTAWMGILDLRSGKLEFANAGHNPPLIRHKSGKFEYLRTKPNFVLAGIEGAKYKKYEIQILPGDEIYLYTDGVTEANNVNNELFGEQRLLETVNRNPSEGVEQRLLTVKAAVDEFVGDADQFDDITMLSVKMIYYQNNDRIVTSPDYESAEDVWNFIDIKTKKAELETRVANRVHIAVDEVYSNILRHSGATYAEVSCFIDEEKLTLIFADNGIKYDPLLKSDPDTTLSADEREIGGLGIFMVKKMASDISYSYSDGCNNLTVVFNLNNT
ncbi:MAG: SpoIIE family protein phosphatase [Clostridia bacterium]|nr:SpoIIE family protein phosphatase [Clostridia bacterium]